MEHFATTVALVGIVIVIASLLSGALERSGIPVVAVFLGLGAALGPWGLRLVDVGFHSPALHVLAVLGLALLLFSDAVTIDIRELKAHRGLLWRLLGPGTVVPAVLVTVAAKWLLGFSWPAAAILGAALASTDPVLLRTVLRSRTIPDVPRIALRMETGMNDVILLPIVVLSILALRTSGAGPERVGVPSADVARSIMGLFLLGPALGAAVGGLGIIVLARVRDRVGVRRDYESLYALGLAFSGFAAAEAVGGSGFLAAFAAGLMVSSQDVELCDCFLEYGEATAEMLLLLTFVALGTSLVWTGLTIIDARTLLFAVIALVIRTAVLYPVLSTSRIAPEDRRLIALFGPRGLSSLLLTLLPVFAGVAGAEELFTVCCLVVLLSVAVHGGGMALFLRRRAHAPSARAGIPASAPGGWAMTESVPEEETSSAPTNVSGRAVPSGERPPLPVYERNVRTDAALRNSIGEVDALRISIGEVHKLRNAGKEVIVADVRADRNYMKSDVIAAGAVRLHPDDPVRDATERRLSQRATLVVYCA